MKPLTSAHPAEGHTRTEAPHVHHDAHEPGHTSGRGGHMLLMLLACVAMFAAVFLLAGSTEGSLGILPWIILLLCPLLHLFMHRGHRGH